MGHRWSREISEPVKRFLPWGRLLLHRLRCHRPRIFWESWKMAQLVLEQSAAWKLRDSPNFTSRKQDRFDRKPSCVFWTGPSVLKLIWKRDAQRDICQKPKQHQRSSWRVSRQSCDDSKSKLRELPLQSVNQQCPNQSKSTERHGIYKPERWRC